MQVLHGAEHDVQWLQRDFKLYLVNMFDTGQAARVLELPYIGLAYLLEHFCGVQSDKRFQLAGKSCFDKLAGAPASHLLNRA